MINTIFNKIEYLFSNIGNKFKSLKIERIENRTKKLNPTFKNNLIITKEYYNPSLFKKIIYCYEIYKLNNIKDSIYIVFSISTT